MLKYAQVHDLPEIIQGDLSSVYKRFLEARVPTFKAVQQEMEDMLVPELKLIRAHFDKKPVLRHICKLADLIEAYTFFIKAQSGDTQHNDVVLGKLRRVIEDKVKTGAHAYNWNVDKVGHFAFSLANPYTESAIVDFEISFDNTRTPR